MRYSKYTIFLKVVELGNFSKTADFYASGGREKWLF